MTLEGEDAAERARIDDEAAAWCARTLSGNITETQKAELERWRSADPRHDAAYRDYMELAEASAAAGAAARADESALRRSHAETVRMRPYWSRRAALLWAAPAVAAVLAFGLLLGPILNSSPAYTERYATRLGEIREIELPDGSVLALNTNTAVEVSLTKTARTILLERGEAYFTVARDERRPFTVNAASAAATALGTAFTVRMIENVSRICVHTGSVAVATTITGRTSRPVTLAAGETVDVDEKSVSPVSDFEASKAATWREGYAHYENVALSRVIQDLNRYYAKPMTIADPRLADIPVTGRFEISDQDLTVEALSIALSLRVERSGSSLLLFPKDD